MTAMGDKIDRLRKEVERLTSERDEAQKLAYVPGLWKCAKCKCTVISNEMHAQTGRFRANNEPQRCPNDCGPMWRVSERDAGNDLVDRLDVLSDRASRAEAKVEEMAKALRHALGLNGPGWARLNLDGAVDDAERGKFDAVCLATMTRVSGQLGAVEDILEAATAPREARPEKTAETAPLDTSGESHVL